MIKISNQWYLLIEVMIGFSILQINQNLNWWIINQKLTIICVNRMKSIIFELLSTTWIWGQKIPTNIKYNSHKNLMNSTISSSLLGLNICLAHLPLYASHSLSCQDSQSSWNKDLYGLHYGSLMSLQTLGYR